MRIRRQLKIHPNLNSRYIFLFLFMLLLCAMWVAGQGLGFRQLTNSRGLSQSQVGSIIMDKKGFMWFGTEDGLNRYDGYTFKYYKHEPGDTTCIDDSYFNDILEDRSGQLWVATSSGLNRFNQAQETFKNYWDKLGRRAVNKILKDRGGKLWLGTDNGLVLFDAVKGRAKVFLRSKDANRHYKKPLNISSIVEDDDGQFWIGSVRMLGFISLIPTCYGIVPTCPEVGVISLNQA